jgi:hypothetical protein
VKIRSQSLALRIAPTTNQRRQTLTLLKAGWPELWRDDPGGISPRIGSTTIAVDRLACRVRRITYPAAPVS